MKKNFTLLVLLIILMGFNAIAQIPTNGLVAFYSFNGNANDESGNDNNGSVNGATLTIDRFGKVDSAYYFDGVDDYIELPNSFDFLPRTIDLWFNTDDADYSISYGSLYQSDNSSLIFGNSGIALKEIDGVKKLLLTISAITDTFDLEINTWYNVAMVASANKELSYYINGILIGNKAFISYLSSVNGLSKTIIGSSRSASNNYFKGSIDDIRIYNRALSSSEIQTIYNESKISISTQNQTNLVGSTFEVPVNISESAASDNIIAYQFEYNYDSTKLEYIGNTLSGTLAENGSLQVNQTPGKLSIAWARQISLVGPGAIINLQFQSIDGGITSPIITNALYNTNALIASNGTITAIYKYGDIDANEMVQAYDAALAIQYSVGLDPIPTIDALPWENWREVSADVDSDENVTANDVSQILKYTVGLITSFPVESDKKSLKGTTEADVTITIENSEIVFRSNGELCGLNVFVKQNKENLGQPTILDANMLAATNISASSYAIGLASIYSPENGVPFMKIPFATLQNVDVTFDMIINTTTKSLTVGLSTGIITINKQVISVYPNPTNNILYITGLEHTANVIIYDLSGKVLVNKQLRNNQIDVSSLKNGFYTINISDGTLYKVIKFVKQ